MSRPSAIHQLTAALNGSPVYAGTIQSINPAVKDNSNTLVTFVLKPGVAYALVADAACVFNTGVAADGLVTLTAANGFPLAANAPWPVVLRTREDRIQILANTGTANVKVFELPI
jgi:hypothetical protein